MEDYKRCIDYWDMVFASEDYKIPVVGETGIGTLDLAMNWLCEDAIHVVDFGCGNGSLLFCCAYLGTKEHIGIDLSREAIYSATTRGNMMQIGKYLFQVGGVEAIDQIDDSSIDSIILSNILDNLYHEDAARLLQSCNRILRSGGKLLVKLNPYLNDQQISDWNIQVIHGNLLNDGLLLWNNTTVEWRRILEEYFTVYQEDIANYPEFDQTNRLFLLLKEHK
jgi:arsenite methyltransferase